MAPLKKGPKSRVKNPFGLIPTAPQKRGEKLPKWDPNGGAQKRKGAFPTLGTNPNSQRLFPKT